METNRKDMKQPLLFRQYIWLVETIYNAGKISFEEINRKWVRTDMSDHQPMARSTFNRHLDAIQDMFDIYIECDRHDGYRYYIGNERVLKGNTIQNWILSTMSVSNTISESSSLQDRILLESIPSEKGYLSVITNAMKQNSRIVIMYKRYGAAEPKRLTIDPYALKMFRQRWYVLGHFKNGNFGVFSFDRIESIEVLDEQFEMEDDFDAATYFQECFGVVQGDGTPCQRIVLRAYNAEPYYMRDLPLHPSQTEIGQGENYVDFELMMRPTLDFSTHILSRGAQLKVLEPEWLAQEVVDMLLDSLDNYDVGVID